MVVRPRRPTTDKFFSFEKEVMDRAVDRYDYVWPERAEVRLKECKTTQRAKS